jgi:hypothetical protein
MRIRGMLVALVVLAALGGAVWYSNKVKKAEESKPSADATPKVISIPEEQFRQIEIKKRDGETTVVKRDSAGSPWQITAPKPLNADPDAMSSLVSSLASLSSDRLVEEKAGDLGGYGLAAPSLEVSITTADGKVRQLLVGDDTPTGGGAFAKTAGDPRVFTIASYNKTGVDKTSKDLRDKRLLTFDSEKLSRVELTAKKQSFEFGRNAQNEWAILKPRPLRADGGQVEELVRKLKDARMDTSISDDEAKKSVSAFGSGAMVAVARVTDASGTQQIEVRKDKSNNYYAKSSVVEGVHKVTSDLGDGLDKGLDDFRNQKLFDFGFNDPARVSFRDGSKNSVFVKGGDKWWLNGKPMDSASLQTLVDRLRDLASIKFVEAGFTTPAIEISVTSKDGKLVEKALISKSGNSYFARRENEPATYELDGKAVEELQKAAGDVKEYQPPKDQKKK